MAEHPLDENQPPVPSSSGLPKMLVVISGILLVAVIGVAGYAVKQQQDIRSQAQIKVTPTPFPVTPTPVPTPVGTPIKQTPGPQPSGGSCDVISTNLRPRLLCPTCAGGPYEPKP